MGDCPSMHRFFYLMYIISFQGQPEPSTLGAVDMVEKDRAGRFFPTPHTVVFRFFFHSNSKTGNPHPVSLSTFKSKFEFPKKKLFQEQAGTPTLKAAVENCIGS